MKKLIVLFTTVSLFFAWNANGQSVSSAATGNFIDLGKEIPRSTYFKISRKSPREDWKELTTLHFEQDSALFLADLNTAARHYEIFSMPDKRLFPRIWDMISRAVTLDSVAFYGYTPAYREALKTAYYDDSALPNIKYEYKITNITVSGQRTLSEKIVSGSFPAIRKPDFFLSTMHIEPFNDKMVLKYFSQNTNMPAGIKVFRSTYMQTKFQPVGSLTGSVRQGDTLVYLSVDTLLEKGKTYQYFAVPFDELGNEGLTSDTVRVANIAHNNAPSFNKINTVSLEKENAIKLSWQLDGTPNMNAIYIYRADSYDSADYKLIGSASPQDTIFFDKKIHPVKNYFYMLVPVTQYGNGYPSARIKGMLKANKKALAPATIDAVQNNGKIHLSWTRPEFYTRGYYVYRGSELDTLTQITDLILSDSLTVTFDDVLPKGYKGKTLTYGVKAVNTSYDISPLSAIINVVSPSVISVATPINVMAKRLGNNVLIYWNNKVDENILGFNLWRKIVGEEKFTKMSTEPLISATNSFIDSTANVSTSYEYALQAIGNNYASDLKVNATINALKFKVLPVYNLNSNEIDGKISISWDKTMQEGITGYRVYRIDNENKILLGDVGKDTTRFEDAKPNKDALNTYAITVVQNEIESALSDYISLRIK